MQQMKGRIVAIGLDLSDRSAEYCALDGEGDVVSRGKIALRRAGVIDWAKRIPATTIAIEAGTPSPWVSRTLAECGHEVVVANPVKVALITKNKRKSDPVDAEYLARIVRADRKLLHEIRHRGAQAQLDLQVIRTREIVTGARTKLINHIRMTVKSHGERLPSCSAEAFARRAGTAMPESLRAVMEPILTMIEDLTAKIAAFDKQVVQMIEQRYPEAKQLMQIKGVGPLTGLTYVLVLEDARRFPKSRSVGGYLGLTPMRDQSGASDPERGISKSGDRLLRRLLLQSSHYILGPFGDDCDLRRHGETIAARGGKRAKKRAAVAVARKLAVLLHRLWVTNARYEPLRNARIKVAA